MLMKEIKDPNKCREKCVYGLKDNPVEMSFIPKLIYWFNAIPVKILETFFCRNRQVYYKNA